MNENTRIKINQNYKNLPKINPIILRIAESIIKESPKIEKEKDIQTRTLKENMVLVTNFLKEQYGENFYNQFLNNFYMGSLKIGMLAKRQLENIQMELQKLLIQNENHELNSLEYQNKLDHLNQVLYFSQKAEEWNSSHVNSRTGEIFLDLKETIEDAFIILHEGFHRIYCPSNTNSLQSELKEAPSLGIEWQLYFYCMKNNIYQEDAQIIMQKRWNNMFQFATRILLENILITIKNENKEITEQEIEERILKIEDQTIRNALKEKLKMKEELNKKEYLTPCNTVMSECLKSFYIGYALNIEENTSENIKYLGMNLFEQEKQILKDLKIDLENIKIVFETKKQK